MTDHHDIDFELLDRYLAGQGTPEELDALARRIESDPSLLEMATALRIASKRPDVPPDWNALAAWMRLQKEIRPTPSRRVHLFPEQRATHSAPSRPWWHSSLRAIAVAAVLLLAVGATLVIRQRLPKPAPIALATEAPREVVTKRQERATLNLADGSRVILGPESRLVIPAQFNRSNDANARELQLEGEALFQVAHDVKHPFRVHTGSVVVSDIGTKFDLRAYANDSVVSVAVAEGSVAVQRMPLSISMGTKADSAANAILHPGELGRFDTAGHLTVRRGVRLDAYFGWVDDRLVFENTPLANVVRTIARWYDLDVRVPASLATHVVNAEFSTQSPDAMLTALANAVGARVERRGRVATLVAVP